MTSGRSVHAFEPPRGDQKGETAGVLCMTRIVRDQRRESPSRKLVPWPDPGQEVATRREPGIFLDAGGPGRMHPSFPELASGATVRSGETMLQLHVLIVPL